MHVLLLLGVAHAATLTVGASGYDSIQAAVDAAADGDEIVVDPGTWTGGVVFGGRALTLRSRDGAATTTIDGGSAFWALTLDQGEGGDTVIADFTIANADGGGVYLVGASPTLRDLVFRGVGASGYATPALASFGGDPVVSGSTFEGNLAAYGGQTYVEGGTATFERCAWREGVAYYGGAMFLTGGALVSVTQSTFAGNEALFGGGAVYVVAGSGLTGTDVEFTDNVADTSNGGALYLEGSTTLGLTGGSFSGNVGASPTVYAQAGGAIFAGEAWVTLDGVRFTANEALYGGAVAVSGGRLESSDAQFEENVGAYGGALSLDGGATVEDDGSIFTGNSATTHGGAVYGSAGWTATFAGTTFRANLAPNGYGGALCGQDGAPTLDGATLADNAAAYAGGALQLDGLGAVATVLDSTFDGNVTTDGPGGAIYAVHGSPVAIEGGAFVDNSASEGGAIFAAFGNDLSATGASFSGNRATGADGGAIAHQYGEGEAGSLLLSGSRFDANEAVSEGGAVSSFAGVAVSVLDSWFADNVAAGMGGAVFVTSPGSLLARRSTFAGNAAGVGGALYVDGPAGGADVTNGIFVDNRADSGGAFCLAGGGAHTWTNNTFVGNAATQDGGVGCLDGASFAFVNNVIAYTRDGAAIHEYDAGAAAGTTFAYNALFENVEGASTGVGANPSTATGAQSGDPLFVAWSDDGDPSDDSFVLFRSSPLVDSGSPQVTDADGTPSDIGAWGGPEVATIDADADGHPVASDCDEGDPNVHPGAEELWYDGVDQDCSGTSDYDADADGVDGAEGGGDDCDDRDATVTTDCDGETGADSGDDTAADSGPKTDGAATGGGLRLRRERARRGAPGRAPGAGRAAAARGAVRPGLALVVLLAGCSSSIGLEKEPEYDDTAADSARDTAGETAESAEDTSVDSAGDSEPEETAVEETGDSAPPDTGETGETGDTAPPPDVVWTLDEYGTRWTGYPASTSVHAPTSAIEAAFAVEDVGKIWVVTRYTWHVMVADTLEWIDSGDRDALFPEAHGLGVSVAASVPAFWGGTTTADVYLLVGDQAYLYYYDTTANRFSFNTQAALGPEWGDPGAPDPGVLRAGWLAVDEDAGWTEIGSPRATCGADADSLSAYLAFTTTTGQAYVYDAGYCADFVGSTPSDRLAPFLLPGAPDPDAAAAIDWTGQALVVFAE